MNRHRPQIRGVLVLQVISDTVLDIGQQEWPVETVAELDACLDQITTEVTDHRVRPVEVGIYDGAEGPALFIGVGASASYVVYLSCTGNHFHSIGAGTAATIPEFDIPARALIPIEQAREAMRQFLTKRCQPEAVAWEQVET